MGVPLYLIAIGLPSAAHFGAHKWLEDPDYYIRPWEAGADMFGGVAPRTVGYSARTSIDETRAWWYLIVSMLFGPFAYFFVYELNGGFSEKAARNIDIGSNLFQYCCV